MKLSDITTEDGVKLKLGGVYYTPGFTADYGVEVGTASEPKFGYTPKYVFTQGGRVFYIVNGVAKNLWASRTTLESGLGRGAT